MRNSFLARTRIGAAGASRGRRRRLCTAAVIVLLLTSAFALAACGSSSGPNLTGSGYSNGNLSNTRFSGGPINAATVSKLQVAWTLPLTAKSAYGSYSSAPVIADGVIYSEDLASNVEAIDLQTGHVIWKKSYESPDQGPNGLVVAGGRVYGATASAAFALDEKTGRQIWSDVLVRNGAEGIDMTPGYHNGIVYVSTVPGNNAAFYGGGGVGILWAINGATGAKLWQFDTAPENLWASEHANINSGGGVWYPPAFDEQGSMYVGIGNPGPFPGNKQYPWGSSRPGPNLYTNCIVKLNAATGKVEWYYQLTPHDLYDRDLEAPPILMTVEGKPMVIAAGKAGIVIALDPSTGKLLWKRSVGTHNGHDNDGVYAMKHEYSKLHLPETVYPGLLGGVIAPLSTDGSTLFVPVVNIPISYSKEQTVTAEGPPFGGEVVALSAATGAVKWKQILTAPAFGATTAVNNVVFTTDFTGTLYAFEAASGKILWQTQLPARINTGVQVAGDMVIAPAGVAAAPGQTAKMVAYRLG